MSRTSLAALACSAFLLVSTGANAQDATPKISLELNKIAATDTGGCQLTVLGANGLDQSFDDVAWDLAIFDQDGVFKQLLRLPMGNLSSGKRRIARFNLTDACDSLSEMFVNDAATCKISGQSGETDICLTQLEVSSRTEIAFGL